MDQDLMAVVKKKKHSCKLCFKSFPSGRSLGGHMRSHVTANNSSNYSVVAAASEDVEVEGEEEKLQPGYKLRENPKKTWRISDDADSMSGFGERQCRVCGREFQSLKALFGHMKSHSVKGGQVVTKEEEEVEEEDDEEQGHEIWSGGGSHIARKRRRSSGWGPNSSFSSVSGFDKEHEDVAISLMMLSRDVGFVFGLEHGGSESSEKNKVDVLDDDSDTDYFDSAETTSDDSFKKQHKIPTMIQRYDSYESILIKEPRMRSVKYECTTCKKSFDTYHALGGHRASHKRMKGCIMVEVASSSSSSIVEKSKGNYECHICGKVFGSGQALGGHKRSHLVMASPAIVIQKEEEEEEEVDEEEVVVLPELLDLNLPAPID